jgi:hypothetical protein
VIDLSCWKITLPIEGNSGNPAEVKQPALNAFTHAKWFRRQTDGSLVFAAPVTGFTTSGSQYPRSELREMKPCGRDQAAWSSTDGKTHTMTITQAVTRLPGGKPHIVCGQIHDTKNDVSVFRLEGSKLWVTSGDSKHTLLTGSYVLGTRFAVKFEVADGVIHAFYNGRLAAAFSARFTSGFFKAGAYVQANRDNASPVSESNQGEVVVYALEVSHGAPAPVPQPQPVPQPDPPAPPEAPMSEFEKDSRARWPGEELLERDLRGDLHLKQLQLNELVAGVRDIRERLAAIEEKLG